MDRLIDLQDSRLLALEQEFEVELKTLQQVQPQAMAIILSDIAKWRRRGGGRGGVPHSVYKT